MQIPIITTGTLPSSCTAGGNTGKQKYPIVDFQGLLTASELKYAQLCACIDFFQLVKTAQYMQEGLTFREATIKYLTSKNYKIVRCEETHNQFRKLGIT